MKKSRKSISNQDISKRSKHRKSKNKRDLHETVTYTKMIKNDPIREHSGYIGEGKSQLEGQYGTSEGISGMSGISRETSRKFSHETGDLEVSKERLKQRLINRIDFANKNMTNSDRSKSPHLQSVYSRQAQILSPGGHYKSHYGLSYSSNKSVSQLSSKDVDGHRRFVAQGLMITNSRKESGLTDKDSGVLENEEAMITLSKSPAIKYKQIRDRLHKNQHNYQNDSRNGSQDKNLIQIRPIPKSFKSSFLPQPAQTHLTPQIDHIRQKLNVKQ